jgi:hypothetical protein
VYLSFGELNLIASGLSNSFHAGRFGHSFEGEAHMFIDLPKPIAAYFTADKGDSEAVVRCFTENAVVKDEKHVYNGVAAIKQWKADSSKKYSYSTEPFASEHKDNKTVITCQLIGNFPGSPVDLRYLFELKGDKIASLEIIP